MDVKQTGTILEVIRMAYPKYGKDFSEEEHKKQLALWYRHFAAEDFGIVMTILDEYIEHNLFPPSIADIKAGIRSISMPSKESLWDELMEAARHSIGTSYIPVDKDHSRKIRNREVEFDKLSEPLKRFVGSPNGLEDIRGELSANALRLKDNFNRRIEGILENCRAEELKERISIGMMQNKQLTGGDADGNI